MFVCIAFLTASYLVYDVLSTDIPILDDKERMAMYQATADSMRNQYLLLAGITLALFLYIISLLRKPQYRSMKLGKFLELHKDNIVWIYKLETTVRTAGIKVGKLNSFVIALDNGHQHQAKLFNNNGYPDMVAYVIQSLGRTINTTYSKELLSKYENDPKSLS